MYMRSGLERQTKIDKAGEIVFYGAVLRDMPQDKKLVKADYSPQDYC
jgi:hypothetical protein